MTLNEALARQNFIVNILLKKGTCELSKELKVKVMSMRIALTRIRTQFEQDAQEAAKGFKPENFDELYTKENKTPEEQIELEDMTNKINDEYNAFIIEKGKEEVAFDKKFTEDEFNQIVEVNADNDIEINKNKLQAADFLEVIHGLFVD